MIVVHALDLGPAFVMSGLDDSYAQAHARVGDVVDREWCAPCASWESNTRASSKKGAQPPRCLPWPTPVTSICSSSAARRRTPSLALPWGAWRTAPWGSLPVRQWWFLPLSAARSGHEGYDDVPALRSSDHLIRRPPSPPRPVVQAPRRRKPRRPAATFSDFGCAAAELGVRVGIGSEPRLAAAVASAVSAAGGRCSISAERRVASGGAGQSRTAIHGRTEYVSGPVSAADAAPEPAVDQPEACDLEIIEGRDAPGRRVGVNRALPRRARRTVGSWCFADHMGPGPVSADRGLDIGPHPHTGLQTVTWLLEARCCTATASAPSR